MFWLSFIMVRIQSEICDLGHYNWDCQVIVHAATHLSPASSPHSAIGSQGGSRPQQQDRRRRERQPHYPVHSHNR